VPKRDFATKFRPAAHADALAEPLAWGTKQLSWLTSSTTMRSIHLAAGAAGIIGCFVACGGDDKPAGFADPEATGGHSGKKGSTEVAAGEGGGGASNHGGTNHAGSGGRAGSGGTKGVGEAGEGGAGGEASVPSGAPPVVTILSPDPVTDPLGGGVIVSDSVNVTCKATQGSESDAAPVDPMSVKIAVLSADGQVVIAEKDATVGGNKDEYTAVVPLTGVENGAVVLRCRARSTTYAEGSDSLDTMADRGPKVTIMAPAKDTRLALKKPVTFTLSALPVPLASGDTQAEVAKVKLTINGVEVPVTPKGEPGIYEAANVDLNALVPKPNGVTDLAASATNRRAPVAATASATSSVFVDGVGPEIIVTSPLPAKIVGGIVTVAFSVTDTGSDVNEDSVVVGINDQKRQYNDTPADWTHIGSTFTLKFESRTFPKSTVQIPINVVAEDRVGNSTTSASIPVYLDNVAPELDLDPYPVRTQTTVGACAAAFDPVGTNAVGDQNIGVGYNVFRAFVWDLTNEVVGSGASLYFSGVDQSSVRLFLRNPNDPKPLLINDQTPGSGACNQIGDSGDQAESINLTALMGGGVLWYGGNKTDPPTSETCTFGGNPKPTTLCNGNSDLWQLLQHSENDLTEPAIYAYSPSAGSDCTGQGWQYSSLVDADGWVCFAARAADQIGNIGVSRPLRLCVDDPAKPGEPACATSSVEPPTCTDGCTPPPRAGGFISRRDN
jgi:hypothetical protein